jgi:zinc transport system substrate-binding protein
MRQARAVVTIAAVLGVAWAPSMSIAAPSVVVTIKPLHALVAQVMLGVGSPMLLVNGLASPHTYALRPSDARALNSADIFVRMSESVEPFTVRIVRSLPKTVEVVTLQEAPRLRSLNRRSEPTFEHHAHGAGEKGGHRHGRAHEPSSAVDGHAWLDPDNAIAMVDHIAESLIAKDPANASNFRANVDALRRRLELLGTELERDLKPIANRPYIVFHDATQYLERRYGLNAVGSISVNPEVPASAKRIGQLRRRIAELGAVCIFAEPQFNGRIVETLIEGTRARSGTLDPEGGQLEPGPELYFTLMRQLAGDLRSCLLPPA